MINLLRSIVDTISSVVTFFIHSLQSFVTFISNIPRFLQILRNSMNLIPEVYVTYALTFLLISAMLFLIGREQS